MNLNEELDARLEKLEEQVERLIDLMLSLVDVLTEKRIITPRKESSNENPNQD
jgi:uncharacterized protein (DUF342 family)